MSAPSSVQIDSVRCLLVATLLTGDKDAQVAQAAQFSWGYWLGRVNGETADADVERVLSDLKSQVTPELAASEITRCGEEMAKRGAEMQQLGQRVTKAAEQPK